MTEETAPLGVELAHAGLVLLVAEVRDLWRTGGIGVCDGGLGFGVEVCGSVVSGKQGLLILGFQPPHLLLGGFTGASNLS